MVHMDGHVGSERTQGQDGFHKCAPSGNNLNGECEHCSMC
jgi:hypothetical protein